MKPDKYNTFGFHTREGVCLLDIGQGSATQQLPPAVKRWNWGAMLLNVIWGARYNVDFAFLTLVPVVGLIVPFVLGIKGGEWAWKKNHWQSAAEYEKSQANWTLWGFATWFFLAVILFIPAVNTAILLKWNRSAVYQQTAPAFIRLEHIKAILGDRLSYRLYASKRLSDQLRYLGIRFKGTQTALKARFYVMEIDGQWAVYRITLFKPNNRSFVDFPLPPEWLLYGPGEMPDQADSPPKNHDVILADAGSKAPYRRLARVISELQDSLSETDALDLVRFPPKIIYRGATKTGALKIKKKLEDFGATVEIQERADPR
ncbi:ribosomal protein L7/L12 [candidate division FCPU426 bacterium]|nr:ribosomal protein L7/L12 [candidate division FCPU426 bacterium]